MSSLCKELCECNLCGRRDVCFELDFADCPELDDSQKEGKVGCLECLKEGRFLFRNDIENWRDDFAAEVLAELARTPEIATWQDGFWLTHCNDIMVYQGTWEPEDFYKNAPDGDGRALFMEMTDEGQCLWENALKCQFELDRCLPKHDRFLLKDKDKMRLRSWGATYYVFKCLHCGKLRGYWDCD